jgi:hypothetical protein
LSRLAAELDASGAMVARFICRERVNVELMIKGGSWGVKF